MADLPLQVALLEIARLPAYQRIAPKVLQLQELGLSLSATARRLGVTDKTVAKGLRWLKQLPSPRAGGC